MNIEYLFNDRFCIDLLNETVDDYKKFRKNAIIISIISIIINVLLLLSLNHISKMSTLSANMQDSAFVIIFVLMFLIPFSFYHIINIFIFNSKNAKKEIYNLEKQELDFLNAMICCKNDPDIMMNVYQLFKNDKLFKSHVTYYYNNKNRLIISINLNDFKLFNDVLRSKNYYNLSDYLNQYQLQAYNDLNKPLNSDDMYELFKTRLEELNLDINKIESYEEYHQKVNKIKNKNKKVIQ